MQIKKMLEYSEKYLPTPRCRKWRIRHVKAEFTAKICEAALSDAPVVLKVHDYETYAEGLNTTDYRLYDGKLYVQALYGRYHNCDKAVYANPVTVASDLNRLFIFGNRHLGREGVAADYQAQADKLLILEGIVWIKATEPFYAVQCFGLGGNHGGTALMIDRNWHHAFDEDTYSALERETAVKEAVQIALARGDTESVAHIQSKEYRIEVLDPSVIKFHRQPRIFQAERIVTSTVNVKTYSYGRAVEIAKQLPESCFVKQSVSWHNNGEVDSDETFYTEVEVMAQPEQAQAKSGNSGNDVTHDCPWWGTDWGYECPYSGHGVCFDTPCNGPVEYEEDEDETVQGDTEAETVTAPEAQYGADDGLEISRMLTISTAHIAESTFDLLMGCDNAGARHGYSGICVYSKADYGFFIYIDKEEFMANIENDDCPEDLFAVVKYAIAHGCSVLCLDSDGKMIVKDLPIYEW